VVSCNVECVVLNLIPKKEGLAEAVGNAKVAIKLFVQDADMEIPSLMKKNLIIFPSFKEN